MTSAVLRSAGIVLGTACGRIGFDAGVATPPDTSDCGSVALSTGLLGLWELDEGSGITATDAAAGHSGDLLGGPSWGAGRFGGALVFDGVDDHVDIRDGIVYAVHTRPLTFSAWFVLDDYSTMTPDIMQIRSDTPSPWHVLMSSQSSYLGVSIGSGDGMWTPIRTTIQPTTDVWHHVVVTFDGVDSTAIASYQIYLDGDAQPLEAAAGYGVQGQQSRIGAAEDPRNQWIGSIDDVRIYDRVVTGIELGRLAAGCR